MVEPPARRGVRRRTWILLLVLGGLLFGLLRAVPGLAEPPERSAFYTEQVVVVGVTARPAMTPTDREVLGAHTDDAQVGMIAVRPRYVGDCAAAGWTTLGAGRRAAVGGRCDPLVANGRVTDWAERVAAAAARRGDAHPGTLAASVRGCVAAVGPGAALAAARPDGTLADYRTPADFLAGGLRIGCPVTLVDAGSRSDEVIRRLAERDDLTLLVTGIGPAAGSDDPALQLVYRIGTTLPGWLSSASTRRTGIVTLTDLTRTLIEFAPADGAAAATTVDGSPFTVRTEQVTLPGIDALTTRVAALSDAAPIGYLVVGAVGVALGAVLVAGLVRRRFAVSRRVLTVGAVITASMMLAGAVPWPDLPAPGVVAGLAAAGWMAVLTAAAYGLGRAFRAPAVIAAAALTVAAFTVEAALGGPMEPGSLLNSRPVFGLRWYGFGNVTFAAYASAALLLAGYAAFRLRAAGRPGAALGVVAGLGLGVVLCEGWPSMGSDFGGVIALTPVLVGLLLVLSGVRITPLRALLVGGSAVVAVGAISLLDWSRGPDRRSHLGNFVQRVLDGDALDVVARKAVASAETVASPLGLGALLVGGALWVGILRWAVPAVGERFGTARETALAILAVAVLGTLLNDGGISVFITATAAAAVTFGWFALDAAHAHRTPDRPASGRR